MDITQQISNMVIQNVQQAYHARIDMLTLAATLARIPNWKAFLKQEYETYVADMRSQAVENKNKLNNQVAADKLLAARGAVDDALDVVLKSTEAHYTNLISMIERLTTEE